MTVQRSTARPLGRLRRALVQAMTASATVPQFTLERRVDLRAVEQLRQTEDRAFGYEDAVVGALARSLRDHPGLNASFADGALVGHERVHVGCAIEVDDGLVAPAVLDADILPVREIAAERRRLVAAARAGRLTTTELLSATATVSNLGPFGVDRFRALVTPPQATVVALGAVVDGHAWCSLSVDHRVADGAPAARFLADLVGLLADPACLLEPTPRSHACPS